MMSLVTGVLGVIGTGVKGFFGVKESQVEGIHKTIEAIGESNSSAAEKEKAIAAVIGAEMQSGYWLAAVWRPLVMVALAGIVLAYFMGFTTPELLAPIPEGSSMREVFELLKLGLMGYMPLRTVEKIASQVNAGKIINNLVQKYTSK